MTSRLEQSMCSRPVYGELGPRRGCYHMIIADGEGGEAVIALFQKTERDFQIPREKSQIIYIPGANGTDLSAELEALGTARCDVRPSYAAAAPLINRALSDALMGLQVYLAGTEGLIGQALRDVMEAGLPQEAVQTEHRGPTMRRVQCLHCKTIAENVRTSLFLCSHCGLHLSVREHYSRRLAAFQGVCADAEEPGRMTEPAERFT